MTRHHTDHLIIGNCAAGISAAENSATVTLGTQHFPEGHGAVREALAQADTVVIEEAFAQRYLGCAMPEGKSLKIHGVPGNDMACYMCGGQIEVFGNAQDQVANTMDDGLIVIHGRCGDATGYGMRGGEIFVRDGVGWRVGIHMKQYQDKCPTIVAGGDAGAFLGEYMAGGIIVLMGKPGPCLATGMHGGVIYVLGGVSDDEVLPGLMQLPCDEGDEPVLNSLLKRYGQYFEKEITYTAADFKKIVPESSRPYAAMYAN